MQKKYALLLATVVATSAYAGQDKLTLKYEQLNFTNSKKKDNGKRVGVQLSHKDAANLYELLYERTDTNTFQPPLKKDLLVDKYYFKYTRKLENNQAFSLSYATIDDNIMKETDGGNIYGLGYTYNDIAITQYISDYKHFNVYQTDLSYGYEKEYGLWEFHGKVMGKYIHLQDRKSNNFSKKAKEDYATVGLKLHIHYDDYHFGVGAFVGDRIFAVMNDGFKVQHHAMAFNKTYKCGIGKHFDWGDIKLQYIYQEATEVPINNKDVEVQNVVLQVGYKF